MQKRDGFLLKNIASLQIFLVIFSIFSFAFLIAETSKVEAQSVSPVPIQTPYSPVPKVTLANLEVGGVEEVWRWDGPVNPGDLSSFHLFGFPNEYEGQKYNLLNRLPPECFLKSLPVLF